MAKTGEGAVKQIVKEFLLQRGLVASAKAATATTANTGKYHMPVSNGMGVAGIPDFYGHYRGFFFEIETKVPGKNPTALQAIQLKATAVTGAKSFVVREQADLFEIEKWFREIYENIKSH